MQQPVKRVWADWGSVLAGGYLAFVLVGLVRGTLSTQPFALFDTIFATAPWSFLALLAGSALHAGPAGALAEATLLVGIAASGLFNAFIVRGIVRRIESLPG